MKHFVIQHTKFLFFGIVVCILLVGVWFKLATTSNKPNSLPPLLSAKSLSELIVSFASDSSATGVVFTSAQGTEPLVYAEYAYGQINAESAMPLHARFYLAGASHAILVTLLLRLQDLGIVHVDQALAQYVPEATHASVLTLSNLATHSSGLSDYLRLQEFQREVETDPSRIWQAPELFQWVQNKPLSFIPGNDVRYSATNGVLLGEALARATNMSLAEALHEYVFNPLSLNATTYMMMPFSGDFSYGYRYAHPQFAYKPGPTLTHLEQWRLEWAGPSKSIVSTSADLTQFMHLVMSSDFLSTGSRRLLAGLDAPVNRGWQTGLGMSQYLGSSVVRGNVHGVSIFAAYVPEYNLSFSVLANLDASRSGAIPAELIGTKVLETIYGMR
ncbi:MAG: serine hydrolase [Alteromonadaceae bacterium]|nr:serine hydrolase [Alteromonadaceae bacterium]